MGKRGEKRKVIPQKGRSPRLREEEAAALFWQAGCPFARAWEKFSESQKIMKIIRLLPPTNWENILKKCRCGINSIFILSLNIFYLHYPLYIYKINDFFY
jgi:hypothetical protein